jgi:hypothetical protein
LKVKAAVAGVAHDAVPVSSDTTPFTSSGPD